MSACANIYCLFRHGAPDSDRIGRLQATIWNRLGYAGEAAPGNSEYGRLVPTEDADLSYDFQEDGTLKRLDHARHSALLGEASRERRFFAIHYLTRWWTEDCPEGPLLQYAVTLLTLLAQPDVEFVWFGPDGWNSMKASSSVQVQQLLDSYIRIGQK